MASSNRSALIIKSYKILKKHFQPQVDLIERSVLENLLFASCLENADYDRALTAFERVKAEAFDWNELRVTSVTELAEQMAGLPEPKIAATSLKQTLHSVFESLYAFDLEHLKKQNLGKTVKELLTMEGPSPFTVAYTVQHSLSGHAIPIDRGALEIFYIVGIIDEKEKHSKTVRGLERAIPKSNGQEYGSLLHQLVAMFVASPFSPQVRSILLEMDPKCQPRFPKRKSRKKQTPDKTATTMTPEKATPEKGTPAKTPAKKDAKSKKTSATAKTAAKSAAPTKQDASKQDASKQDASKKGASKKGASKKGASKKGASKKGASKKGASKKGTSKKGASKKGASKKGASKKASGNKATKKPAAKKSSTKKATSGKTSSKKPVKKKMPARSISTSKQLTRSKAK